MLFNSYEFLFLFLPLTLAVFHLLGRQHRRLALAWLTLTSLWYYGWWNPRYLVLIVASMLANYALGRLLSRKDWPDEARRWLLGAGIAANLALLGYYKYAGFLAVNLGALTGHDWRLGDILLPVGISFFTFQQIAFLVDAYRVGDVERDFVNYCLFVTFFPQLIAGPIVHHAEMLPQFQQELRVRRRNLAVGAAIFSIGLCKKVVIADTLATLGAPVFRDADAGLPLTLLEAWAGVLAYTLQLYFDFSGYSDMAIGGARLFGIRLPLNFHSPYRADSIIEFWRRWHMTLSRFLRDYLYIPLGGNRRGPARRAVNVLVTMLLGGLWHGAGWTFVLWGGLHGVYLVVNQAWRTLKERLGWTAAPRWWERAGARTLTFLAVVVGWVFFRAETWRGATHLLACLGGRDGLALPVGWLKEFNKLAGLGDALQTAGLRFVALPHAGAALPLWFLLATLVFVHVAPNTQEFMARYQPALEHRAAPGAARRRTRWQWRMTPAWGVAGALCLSAAVFCFGRISEFLYYRF